MTTESLDVQPVADRALGRQLVHNSIATGIYYGLSLVVGLWFTRYTVHTLGIALLAVVSLASGFIAYLQFVTTGIGASVGRYVLADYAVGDTDAANRTFNSYLVAAERVSLILLAVIAGIVWFLVPHLDYPQGQLGATRFVFAAILGSTVIQVWSLCFDSAIWVSGRIDIRNGIYALELLVRTGTVVALFTVSQPQIWHIGLANLIASLLSLSLYFTAWKKLTPELTIDRSLFDPKRYRKLSGMGGWLAVMQGGGMMQFNSDMLLLNVMLGREIQGSYGLLLSWVNILRGLFASMGQLVSPSLAALQASEDSVKLSELSSKAVRMQGLLISIPVGVLCGLAGPALNWWLGPNFVFLAPLAWLVLVPLVMEGSFYPAFILIQTHEAIAFTAIATAIVGVTNILLGIALVKFTSFGMYGIAIAVAATSLIRHAIVLPAYAARVLGQPWYLFIQQQSQVAIQLGVTGVIAFFVAQQMTSNRSFIQLLTAAIVAGGISAGLALVQLSQDERGRLLAIVRRR
ncbi:MAG TPA: hypothetical protein VGL72_05020 [Bryobacteraceae bacterium]